MSEPTEQVYGGGTQFSHFNLKGKAYPIWTREQGVGRNKATQMTFWVKTQFLTFPDSIQHAGMLPPCT